MNKKTITIFGASGFVGSYVVSDLAKAGHKINAITRDTGKAKHLKIMGFPGQITIKSTDLFSLESLEKTIEGSDIVINLLGILAEGSGASFNKIHTSFPRLLAQACKNKKITDLIHFSALGIEESAKVAKYAESKLKGEAAIFDNFPNATILRPSVIFGRGDNFVNLFAKFLKLFPTFPLFRMGRTKFQPVFVEDVALSVAKIAEFEKNSYQGKIIELYGPDILTMEEILEFILSILSKDVILIKLPDCISYFSAIFMGILPGKIFTLDQYKMLGFDNIAGKNLSLKDLGIKTRKFKNIVPTYLNNEEQKLKIF